MKKVFLIEYRRHNNTPIYIAVARDLNTAKELAWGEIEANQDTILNDDDFYIYTEDGCVKISEQVVHFINL